MESKSPEVCEVPNKEQDQNFVSKRTPSNHARLMESQSHKLDYSLTSAPNHSRELSFHTTLQKDDEI